jgi:RNA polymerase II subunit A small phosphatase-like protein
MRDLVIFDLDETLVHATTTPLPRAADFQCAEYFVYIRPHLDAMLADVAATHDMAVWSSSSRSYVDQVAARLFGSRFALQFAWCADQCVQRVDPHSGGYVYIKDLRKAQKWGYAVDQMTMVDDSAEKVARQPRRHLPITPFTGQASDTELLALAKRLPAPIPQN